MKDTAFDIISLNDNAVLVEGKLYKKNEVVKTIRTDIEGVASTSADLLPYGNFRIVESEAPDGYLTDGAKPIDFTITENGKIVDLTEKAHSIYNQIKRGDIEGVKIGAGTHKRLADVPFRITSKTTGENHVVVTDDNGQFSTSAEWLLISTIQTQERPARTVCGLELLNQTTAKVRYLTILTSLKNYALTVTKALSLSHRLKS